MTHPKGQHPALKLPGFTRTVALSTGLTAHIRKVDVTAVSMGATRDLAASGDIAPGQMDIVDQASLALDVRRRLIRTSLIEPTLPELLEVYGGTPEDDDYGLGSDFTVLVDTIEAFSSLPAQTAGTPTPEPTE